MDYTPAKLYSAKGDISKSWYAYFFERDPQSGKMIMIKKRGKINYIKSAKKRLIAGNELVTEINELLRDGWRSNGQKILMVPLKDVIEEMIRIKNPSLRKPSETAYKYAKGIFFAWLDKKKLAYIFPEQFDNQMCHSYCDYLITEKKFSGRNFNNQKGFMRTLFNMMLEREIIQKNPFTKVKSQPHQAGRNIPFSDKQRQALIDEMIIKDYRLYLFTQFIYYCFLRPMELTRIKIGNIDVEKKKITLHGSQTKNKKNDSVVIPDAFIPIIRSMELNKYDSNWFVFGKQKHHALIPGPKSIGRNIASDRHLKIRKRLKLDPVFTLYSWKDTGVVNAYNAGIPLYYLMMQLRHSSLAQTQIYLNSLGLFDNVEFGTKMK